ncbi:peptidyl-prolyl cis-trans isomerase C [Mesorhizobium soli]|uniref:peptidylprolyl isomerase n=1 Tax=Pseudaminobacter soli (ex Li et al. 2025) TaxID=1295366 RepID=UPI00247491E0|nr:peptidylprolyl isomerase [Mesorhizobium soli]MDH6234854.1 peptidyl-prolyl cis-trans isomerase C [Mesorhizobium soli]
MTAYVNGVPVPGDVEDAKLAVVRELLRQRAVEAGFLDPGAIDNEVVEAAIEKLLAQDVQVPTPSEAECQRYYEAHLEEFRSGDLVHARHILFQVTPSVNIAVIRARAEQALNELLADPERFAEMARELSNCPSGEQGGNLGQIGRGDMVPEFESALFRIDALGILPHLVKTRFGFHIVSVDRSIPGVDIPFEHAREQIAEALSATVEERALRQYIAILAGRAELLGVEIDAADTPLVQ